MKRFLILSLFLVLGFGAFAQSTTNSKFQSPLKSGEALYKLDYDMLGKCVMVTGYTNTVTFYLRKWSNLATKAKKYEVYLDFDKSAVIDKGEWDYVINCLSYIQEEQEKEGGLDSEYRFTLNNGIGFFTERGKKGVKVLFPIDSRNPNLVDVDSWISFLKAAKERAK